MHPLQLLPHFWVLCSVFVHHLCAKICRYARFSTMVSHVKAEMFVICLRCHVCVRFSTTLKLKEVVKS